MKTLRKLFGGVLLAVCVSMLGIGGLFLNINTKTADAIYTDDTTSYVKVDELYHDASGKMNSDNVDLLLKYITGDASASVFSPSTMSTVENLASATTSSADIRSKTVTVGNVTKSSSQDVIVTLGGLDWQVVYLSKDNQGNNILTLWLSSSEQDAFAGRTADEGTLYGFINNSLYSDWSNDFSTASTSVSYPSNMYGTSYIRAVTLNNGGTYATSTSASTTAEQNENNVFAKFTMDGVEGSLTSYLVTPSEVNWQLLQNDPSNTSSSYFNPNDSINDPTGVLEGGYYSGYNYHSKKGYSAWGNDYIWLPSLAETGYNSSNSGLWQTSQTQRQNISSSTSQITLGVGSDNSEYGTYVYNYSWLRSGYNLDASNAYYLNPSGDGRSHLNYVYRSRAVRPALHLNLNAVALNSTPSDYVEVGELYDTETSKMNAENVDFLLKYILGDENASASDPDTLQTLEDLAYATNSSADIRGREVTVGGVPKSSSQDIIVSLGGLVWQVMYLSKDLEGNNILTLWLANSNDTSTWSSGWGSSSTNVNYPSNMYGTSYIRAVTLNNGGAYATSTSATTTAEQNENSVFARFTMEEVEGSLTSFLVTPNDVSWQLLQSNPENNPSLFTLNPNDSINDPAGILEGDYHSTSFNYHTKEGYSAWATDYIWLPSVAETGINTSNIGLWETSTSQRANFDNSWLRSGYPSGANYACSLVPSGEAYALTFVFYSYTVRPALHLNLNSVVLSATSGAEAGEKDLAYASVQSPDMAHTGESILPKLKVSFGNEVLEENVDYTIEFSNNQNEGDALVTITAVPNSGYVGTKETKFKIGNGYAAYFDVELSETEIEWAGDETAPSYTLSDYYGVPLVENEDYTVSVPDLKLGTNNLVFTGMGEYLGKKTLTFNVVARDIAKEGRLEVDGLDSLVYTGSAITPTFSVRDTEIGLDLVNRTHYTYQFSNNTNAGTATLNLTGRGNYSGTASFTFNIEEKDLSNGTFTLNNNSFTYNGQTQVPTVTYRLDNVTLVKDRDYTLTYHRTTTDGEVVENPTDAETYYIVIEGIGNYKGSNSTSFVINQGTINSNAVTLSQNSFTYNRAEQKPSVTVRVNNRVLLEDEFLVEIHKGSATGEMVSNPTDAGTYYVVVNTNNPNYTGYGTKSFVINTASIVGGSLTLKGSLDGFVYAGENVKPEVDSLITNYQNNTLILQEGEYSVSYSNNNGAGTATITINGLGNFSGALQQSFNIEQGVLTTLEITFGEKTGQNVSVEYKGEAYSAPTFVVKDAGGNVVSANDYAVSYSSTDYTNVGVINITISPKQNGGKYNYIGSVNGSIQITQKTLTEDDVVVTLSENSYTFDGTAKTPTVTVKLGTLTLSKDVAYTVTYADNINASENAKVQINFIGNYSGAIEKTFEIAQKDISSATATISSQIFTGEEIEPDFVVSDMRAGASMRLVKDVDYTVEYSDNVNVSNSAKATIKGKGNYSGEKTFTFSIVGISISGAVISANNVIYTGAENKPAVTVILAGKTLEETTDYTLSYSGDLVNAGVVTVTATGTGNYAGQVSTSYTIEPKDVSSFTVNVQDENLTYDRTAKRPTFTVFDGEAQVDISNFYATYSSNINAGEGVLTLRATGNYTGTLTENFTIQKATISSVSLFENVVTYTGEEIEVGVSEVKAGDTVLFASEYDVKYDNNTVVGEATVTVTAKAKSNFTGSKSATFTISKAVISGISLSTSSAIYSGQAQSISVAEAWTSNGTRVTSGYTAHYARDNGSGYETTTDFTSAGVVRVTITLDEGSNYALADDVYADFVIERRNLNNGLNISYFTTDDEGEEISLTGDLTYVGREVYPKLFFGGAQLIKDTDFEYVVTLSGRVESGEHTNAGEYSLTITGLGNYTGVVIKNYKVIAADIDFTNQEFDYVVNETFTYDGNAQTFENISTGIDISYEDSLHGTIELSYGTDFELYSGLYDLANDTPIEEGEVGGSIINVVNGYYANINAGSANLFIEGKNNYEGVARLTFTILARDIEDAQISVASDELIYDGKEKKPNISISLDGFDTFTENEDYYIVYENNINAGNSAKVTVYGRNNFTGSKSVTFTIQKRSIVSEEFTISTLSNLAFDRDEHKLAPEIFFNGTPLSVSKDYTLSYLRDGEVTTDFVNAGEIVVKISGFGNFEGEREVSYEITKISLTSSLVSKPGTIENSMYRLADEIFDNTEKKKVLSLVFEGVNLTEDDYTATYSSQSLVNVQEDIIITVVGKGNFEGEIKFIYNIAPASVTGDRIEITISVDEEGTPFTGKEIKPTVQVIDKGADLSQNIDVTQYFDISYSNNTNVSYSNGEVISGAVITIKGTGNYTETYTVNFKITPVDISTLSFDEIEDVTFDGNAHRILPTLVFGEYTLVENTDFTISSSSQNFVNAQNEITITLNGRNNFTGNKQYSYSILKANFETLSERFNLNIENDEIVYTGENITLNFTLKDILRDINLFENEDFEVNYQNNLNAGKATLTITGTGNYAGEITETFTILKKDIGSEDVVINKISNQNYTGLEVEPKITITYNGKVLGEEDFSVVYDNNIDIGDNAKATISGLGNFEGNKEVYFTIVATVVSADTFDIILPNETVVYTGEEITFDEIEVKFADSEITLSSENYTVEYQNNLNVGTASVIVLFSGNYSGTIVENFEITKKNIADEDVTIENIESIVFDGENHAVVPNLNFNGSTLTVNDFSYQYNTSNFVNVQTITINISGAGNFTGSTSVSYEIVPKKFDNSDETENDVVIEITSTNLTYTGKDIEPNIIVTYGTIYLDEEDYEISYSNNKDAGEGTVSITAKSSNYTASLSKTFTINKKQLEYSMLGEISRYAYTGYEIEPEINMTFGEFTLQNTVDYNVDYTNNINASDSAKVIISATENGNFDGEFEATFSITRLSLERAEVSGYQDEYVYQGKDIDLEFSVTVDGYFEENGETLKTLQEGVDFELNESVDLVNVGHKNIVIIGINNFQYQISFSFEIVAENLSNVSVEGFLDEMAYNHGEEVTQNITLKLGEIEIDEASYSISYGNNLTAGSEATLRITPANSNFTGEIVRTFTITKAKPVLNIEEEFENIKGFEGDLLSNLITLPAGATDGTFTFDPEVLTMGTSSYSYTFTPADSENYETITGTITVEVQEVVLESIEVESPRLVEGNIFDNSSIKVFAIYNNGDRIELSLAECGFSLNNGNTLVYGTDVEVTYQNVITSIKVLRSTIENGGFVATSANGFDEGVELVVEALTEIVDIYEVIGSYYNDYRNIEQVITAKLVKDGVDIVGEGITITFNTSVLEKDYYYYLLSDEALEKVESENGIISFVGSYAVLALDEVPDRTILIIVIVCVGILVLTIIALSVSLIVIKRKRKKYAKETNVNEKDDNNSAGNSNADIDQKSNNSQFSPPPPPKELKK